MSAPTGALAERPAYAGVVQGGRDALGRVEVSPTRPGAVAHRCVDYLAGSCNVIVATPTGKNGVRALVP